MTQSASELDSELARKVENQKEDKKTEQCFDVSFYLPPYKGGLTLTNVATLFSFAV